MKLFRTDGYGNAYNPKYQEKQGKQDINRNAPKKYEDNATGDFWKEWDKQHGVIVDKPAPEPKPKYPKESQGKSYRPSNVIAIIERNTYTDVKTGKKGFIVREEDAYIIVKFNDNPIVQLIFKNKRGSL